MCQICNVVDHIVIIYSRIGDLHLKCNKCGLPHRMENFGLRCGYCTRVGHIEDMCWKKGKEVKSHSIAKKYLEMLVDDESTTLE